MIIEYGGGGRETSDTRFSPTLFMIIIIVLLSEQIYYKIVKGRGCFEAEKIIFLISNSIWFAFCHIAFSLNSSELASGHNPYAAENVNA